MKFTNTDLKQSMLYNLRDFRHSINAIKWLRNSDLE